MKKIIYVIIIIMSMHHMLHPFYSSEDFIDFLVHTNQLRIRLDSLGVNADIASNVKFSVGATASQNFANMIVNNTGLSGAYNQGLMKFIPAVSATFGYKNDIIGAAAGFEFFYKTPDYQVYTPMLTFTALDDKFRINIPLSFGKGMRYLKDTLVFSTEIEARYYFNIGPLYHMRFYVNYGNADIGAAGKNGQQYFMQQSAGGELRVYFRTEAPNNVYIDPIIRVRFDAGLKTRWRLSTLYSQDSIADTYFVNAKGFVPNDWGSTGAWGDVTGGANSDPNSLEGGYIAGLPGTYRAYEPYRFAFAFPVGFTAKSDFIDFYLEPALSLTVVGGREILEPDQSDSTGKKYKRAERQTPFYTFGYVVYGEISLKPIENLQWYAEMQTGGASTAGELAGESKNTELIFNASTGITYYF